MFNYKNYLVRLANTDLARSYLKFLLGTKSWRNTVFGCYPKNTLLIAETPREKYIVNSSDKTIGFETFVNGKAYDSEKLAEVIALLPRKHSRKMVVDIGANIGTIGIHAVANQYFETAIGFEPEPQNFKLLEANVALNGLKDNYTAHNLALSDCSGRYLEFELCENNHGDHRVRILEKGGLYQEDSRKSISVKSEVLDNFSQEFDKNSTLIWIDTQGFEAKVLSGASVAISKKIPICLEFWPYGLNRAGGFDHLLKMIANSSYRTLIDLAHPDTPLEPNVKNLQNIANELGFDGAYTDLMLM